MKSSFIFSAFFMLFSIFSFTTSFSQNSKGKKDKIQSVTIKTSGKCEMCKSNIETAVRSVKGVKSSNFDLTNHSVTVSFRVDKTNGDAIRQAISNAGYSADGIEANASAKEKLPKCCK